MAASSPKVLGIDFSSDTRAAIDERLAVAGFVVSP
jgi:hypothetical protein